jgi:hypothetical protein
MRILSLLTMFFLGFHGWAEAASALPSTLNYQGRLKLNAGGAPVPDGNGNTMVFKIYDGVGTLLWTETWDSGSSNVTTTSGLFNVVLGSWNPLTLPFDGPYQLGITVNSDAEMAPRQPLTMAPYAFRAKFADNAGEANTASNLGSGQGIFMAKSGVDLQFKGLRSPNSTIQLSTSGSSINMEADYATNWWNAGKIQGQNVDPTIPSSGNVLIYNGGASRWEPGAVPAAWRR